MSSEFNYNLDRGQKFAIVSSEQGDKLVKIQKKRGKGLFGIFTRKWTVIAPPTGVSGTIHTKLPDFLDKLAKLDLKDQKNVVKALKGERFEKLKKKHTSKRPQLHRIDDAWEKVFQNVERHTTVLNTLQQAIANQQDLGSILENDVRDKDLCQLSNDLNKDELSELVQYLDTDRFPKLLKAAILHEPPCEELVYSLLADLDEYQEGLYASFPGGLQEATDRFVKQKTGSLRQLTDEAFPFRLRQMFEEPVSEIQVKRATQILGEVRGESLDLSKERLFSSFGFMLAMCKNSETLKDVESGELALGNFRATFGACVDLAEAHRESKEKISLDQILQFNGDLCRSLKNNGGESGKFRKLDVAAGGREECSYLPTAAVEKEMGHFTDWLHDEMDKCDRGEGNPILLATQVFRRMVSIHPFPDGNGRSARMVANYVLLRYGIPPPEFEKDQRFAALPLDFDREESTTVDGAATKMMLGVRKSCQTLSKSTGETEGFEKLKGLLRETCWSKEK